MFILEVFKLNFSLLIVIILLLEHSDFFNYIRPYSIEGIQGIQIYSNI